MRVMCIAWLGGFHSRCAVGGLGVECRHVFHYHMAPLMLHKLTALLIVAWMLAACVSTESARGYVLNEEALAGLSVGQSDRRDVLQALGSPSSASDFEGERWHYVSQLEERTSVLSPDLIDQNIVTVEFNDGGVVSAIKRRNADDAREVDISDRTTPTRGHSVGVLEQLLGNFGRFNAPVDSEGNQ